MCTEIRGIVMFNASRVLTHCESVVVPATVEYYDVITCHLLDELNEWKVAEPPLAAKLRRCIAAFDFLGSRTNADVLVSR